MQQSNVPLDLKKGLDLPNNQPKSIFNARQKIRQKRKEKQSSHMRNQFILIMNQQKVEQKQQSNVPFPFGKEW